MRSTADFKRLAYVVVDKNGRKWAGNVVIVIEKAGFFRWDALDNLGDVVATFVAKGESGHLYLPHEGRKYAVKSGRVRLPYVGMLPVTLSEFVDLLTEKGRFPRHVLIKFDHPKLTIEINYKDA